MPVTKRVATQGNTAGTPSSLGSDTWGGTWGGTWGNTWLFGTEATEGTGESPSPSNTQRLSVYPTGGATRRVQAEVAGTNTKRITRV